MILDYSFGAAIPLFWERVYRVIIFMFSLYQPFRETFCSSLSKQVLVNNETVYFMPSEQIVKTDSVSLNLL